MNFFNIRDGIIVLNKIDLVDEDWISLVEEDIHTLLKKYNLDNLSVVKVSAITHNNIDKLGELIEQKIAAQTEIESTQPFRLLVDRSFTIKGFGTVVTGTMLSGMLNKGDDVDILPQGIRTKVRGLQAHGKDTDLVQIGERAAVNLQGISKTEISRGDVLVGAKTLTTSSEFIGTLRTVSDIPLKIMNRAMVRIYTGTAERIGQLIWYDQDKYLNENSDYHVRLKLEAPLAVARNDAFLIRLHSPLVTLAGGRVIEINPPRILHKGAEWHHYFEVMASHELDKIIYTIIDKRILNAVSGVYLQQKLFEQETHISTVTDRLKQQKKIRTVKLKGIDHYISEANFEHMVNTIKEYVSEFHLKNSHLPGINHQELFSGSGYSWLQPEIFDEAIKVLLNRTLLKLDKNYYSLSSFSIKVSRDLDLVQDEILEVIRGSEFAPDTVSEISQKIKLPENEVRSIINLLVENQKLVNINRDIFIDMTIWAKLLSFLGTYFEKTTELPVASLKDYLHTTRKYAIPIFEYLDSQGYTIRSGDVRKKGHKL